MWELNVKDFSYTTENLIFRIFELMTPFWLFSVLEWDACTRKWKNITSKIVLVWMSGNCVHAIYSKEPQRWWRRINHCYQWSVYYLCYDVYSRHVGLCNSSTPTPLSDHSNCVHSRSCHYITCQNIRGIYHLLTQRKQKMLNIL